MPSHPVSSVVLAGALLLLPALFVFDKYEGETWRARLALSDIVPREHRHTPIHTDGTFLPPVITRDRIFTAADSPVILTGTTTIPAHVTVTFEPGVTIYAHEFAMLMVDGQLRAHGSDAASIVFTTNERHEANQVWGGVVFRSGSRGTLHHTTIRLAAPAVSCLPGSVVTIAYARLLGRSVGLFSGSSTCRVTDSTITGQHKAIEYFSGATTLPATRRSYIP